MMLNNLFYVVSLLFASALAGGQASASVISYDISVNSPANRNGWYGGLSWGIPGLPITGSINVDNQSGLVDSFSLSAGPTSWSQANFSVTPSISFDGAGDLIGFNLYKSYSTGSGIYQMTLRSNNFFELFDGNNVAGCFGCVSFLENATVPIPTQRAVPETTTLALLGLGLAVMGFSRHTHLSVRNSW